MISKGNSTIRAFSPAAQESALKHDNINRIAADKNPYGDKPIGDVLNEISDPNYIDPKKVIREHKKDLDKDAFFKLMLTQMKNQDPTNPMQSHEMAAQLAQFTSMEQLSNINQGIEKLQKTQEPAVGYEALNFIGKSISADSSKIYRQSTDKSHELRFTLGSAATETTISIRDKDGKTIRTMQANNLKKGENKVVWNGITQDGLKAREGEYVVAIESKSSNGSKVHADTSASGKITGVNFTTEGPVLMIGNQTIYMRDIKKIEDAELKQVEMAKVKSATVKDDGKQNSSAQQIQEAPAKGNLESLDMSGALKNVVDKQVGT